MRPMEEGDYYLYNRLEQAGGAGRGTRRRTSLAGFDRRGPRQCPARLPGRDRPRGHRRLLLPGGGTDPRRPDRHRHVPPASRAEDSEGRARGVCSGGGIVTPFEIDLREVRGADPAVPRPGAERGRARGGRGPSRRLWVLQQALPLRGQPAPVRAPGVLLRGDVAGAEGEARLAPDVARSDAYSGSGQGPSPLCTDRA